MREVEEETPSDFYFERDK